MMRLSCSLMGRPADSGAIFGRLSVWQNNITVVTALNSGIDLMGMRMLQGNRLTMDVKQSGSIEISPF